MKQPKEYEYEMLLKILTCVQNATDPSVIELNGTC